MIFQKNIQEINVEKKYLFENACWLLVILQVTAIFDVNFVSMTLKIKMSI